MDANDANPNSFRVTDAAFGSDDMGLGREFWEANRRHVIEAERANDSLSLFGDDAEATDAVIPPSGPAPG